MSKEDVTNNILDGFSAGVSGFFSFAEKAVKDNVQGAKFMKGAGAVLGNVINAVNIGSDIADGDYRAAGDKAVAAGTALVVGGAAVADYAANFGS